MRWIKVSILFILLIVGGYTLALHYLVEDGKSIVIEKEINYPVEKVFPQFSNLQNFTKWHLYFSNSDKLSVQYFEPYEGEGSSIAYQQPNRNKSGELYIRYLNPNRTVRYHLYEKGQSHPVQIDIRFKPLGAKTKMIWNVHTPQQSLILKQENLLADNDFIDYLDKSIINLSNIMSNKVGREHLMASIKYDSVMVEQSKTQIILGINTNASNKKDALFRDIIHNHHKVFNHITMDLAKGEDEFGLPIFISDANHYKAKEVAYFYGMPISKRIALQDNNFTFRTINPSKYYTIYYKGNFNGRMKAIQKLTLKAQNDTMRSGELQQIFLQPPMDNSEEVVLKLALPVYK